MKDKLLELKSMMRKSGLSESLELVEDFLQTEDTEQLKSSKSKKHKLDEGRKNVFLTSLSN